MKSGVVAIPLFAAMWLAAPALGAQDQDPPRTAVPRDAQPRAEPRAEPRTEPRARRADPPPPADTANAGEQRSRGGREADGRRGGGRVTPRGYTRPEPRVVERRGPDGRGPVARGPVNRGPVNRPVIINNYSSYRRPAYYPPAYYDRWARSYYRWSPVRYAPWGLISAGVGFSNFSVYGSWSPAYTSYGHPTYGYYGPGHYAGYYAHSPGFDLGGVRLRMRPRDAQVFVDGYYAGIVDDFDGTFQQLRLEQGAHKIEVRMPGFEDLELDVFVQPGRTINIHEDLRPRP